jgi:hypothetical protein
MSINRPELLGAVRLMKIPAATANAAMQPVGATHHRLSPAFATATIQLQAACAATCHIHDKNQLQCPVPPAPEMRRMMNMRAGIHRRENVSMASIARTGCTKLPSWFRPQWNAPTPS